MEVVPVPSPAWAHQLHSRLQKRLIDISQQLELNVRNPAQGADVINTAAKLRALVKAIEQLTSARYWGHMDLENRRGFAELLLSTLKYVVQRDENPYERTGVVRPPYAVETPEDSNLYRRLCADPGAELFVVNVLLRLLNRDGRLLANSVSTVATIYQLVQNRHSVEAADGGRTQRGSPQPRAFIAAVGEIYRQGQSKSDPFMAESLANALRSVLPSKSHRTALNPGTLGDSADQSSATKLLLNQRLFDQPPNTLA